MNTGYVFEYMTDNLSAMEALRWFLIPAALQWIILQETAARHRWLRWAMLLVLWGPVQIVLAIALLVWCGGLLVSLLFQLELADFLSGTAFMMALMFGGCWRLFARFGLLVAGWGSAWAVYQFKGRGMKYRIS